MERGLWGNIYPWSVVCFLIHHRNFLESVGQMMLIRFIGKDIGA